MKDDKAKNYVHRNKAPENETRETKAELTVRRA